MTNNIDPLKKLKDIGIRLSDFEAIKDGTKKYSILGIGNFGYVEKMKSKKNNKIYAIKKIEKNSPKFNLKDLQREIEIMFYLNQENIIKLYGYFVDKENLNKYKEIYNNKKNVNDLNKLKDDIDVYCLVLEYAKNGTLREFYKNKIKNRDKNLVPIEEKDIINILKQLLSGLKHLHDKGVMHRDITPDNILLDEKNNVKITDFGLSAIHQDSKTEKEIKNKQLFSAKTIVGRISYASPQIQKGENYDYSCDIYSLGITILYMMSYENPILVTKDLKGKKNRSLKFEYMHQKYNPYLKTLIVRMAQDEEKLRPTSSEAYDELEVIEIFKSKPNNKIIKKCLDELNSELEMIKKKENKENKNFKKMLTDSNINYNNDIKNENKTQIFSGNKPSIENEFISSGSIYSTSNKKTNLHQSIPNYIPPNPQYLDDYSLSNSVIVGDYPPDINYNFYYTQNNFKRSNTSQISVAMPPPPAEVRPLPTPFKGIQKGLNKIAGFLLNDY